MGMKGKKSKYFFIHLHGRDINESQVDLESMPEVFWQERPYRLCIFYTIQATYTYHL